MAHSDKHLMRMATSALFTHDQDGRIVRVNEPDGDVAPRFFLGRTREGNLWRFRNDLSTEQVRHLESLCIQEPVTSDFGQPPIHLDAIRDILESVIPIKETYIGPEYFFPDDITSTNLAPTQRMTRNNADHLKHHFAWMIPQLDVVPPVYAVVAGGQAVSICFSSRTTPLADEAGVETLDEYRGKGYAPAAVAAWACAIRGLGRIPLYGTEWDNRASQRVASKLGLSLFGESMSLS